MEVRKEHEHQQLNLDKTQLLQSIQDQDQNQSNLDQGQAWFVLVGVTISTSIQVGIISSLGALVQVLSEQFSASTGQIGFAVSLSLGCGAIFGPIAGGLSKVFGARPVVMVTASLCTLGLIIASQAQQMSTLTCAIMLIGMSYAVSEVCLGSLSHYFSKYYLYAVGIATSGISLGIMGAAPLTELLLEAYGWRGAMLILGGLCSHLLITGALLQPIEELDTTSYMYHRPRECTQFDDIKNSSKYRACKFPQAGTRSYKTIIHKLFNHFSNTLDLDLWSSFSYIVLVILLGCLGYTFTGWLIYQTPYALSQHIPPYKASLLQTVGGVGNLLSKLGTPFLKNKLSNRMTIYLSILLKGFSIMTMGMVKDYSAMMILAFVYGSASGIFTVAWYAAIHELAGKDRSVNAIAWAALVNGEVAILSGWLTGWIFDHTGNYTLSFLLLGVAQAIGLLFLLVEDSLSLKKD